MAHIRIDPQSAAKSEMAAEVAGRFGEVRLKLIGGSMLPSLWPDDLLVVRRHPVAELRPGQIVQFMHAGMLVTHRIVRNCGDHLITRGDSVAHEDLPVRANQILGRVVSVTRNGCPLDPSFTRGRRMAAWLLRRSELSSRVLLRCKRLACRS